MSDTAQHAPKRLSFGLLLLISFVLFNIGFIIDQTIRWSDPIYGFLNGVFHVFIFGFVWIVYVLPWSLLILGLYRW
ncbi:MAG: hypothetical protein AAGD22_10530, partial [Verrucomicrobiota bacterium]